MAEPELVGDLDNIEVIIDEGDDNVTTDPESGTVEIEQPDGGVVIQFNPPEEDEPEEADENFYDNLADRIDEGQLSRIAIELYEAVDADDRSRQETLALYARGLDLLGIELRDPRGGATGDSSAVLDGMSTVTNPLLLEAILKCWANAQAELLPSEGPCKVDDTSMVEGAERDQLAEALEQGMNTYLTVGAPEWVPDTSQMLLWGTHLRGSGFKKVYRCPLRRRPVSDAVDAKDLIVSNATKDLRACERITHQIAMRQSVMKRMVFAGVYRDPDLPPPTAVFNEVDQKIGDIQGVSAKSERPEDQPYTIWEIQCELDLPEFAAGKFKGAGIPLPYLVTMDKESQTILAIRRDWKPEDEECERKRMWVKYPYVPGPGFFGTGLLNILGNSTLAMTAAWREALDAGMYANFPAFLMAKLGTRQNTSDVRAGPAQGIPVETNGKPIQDSIMPMPYRDVTPGLMAMIDKVTAQAKELGGSIQIPSGEGTQDIPVGTMLSMIEQATKVMLAAHKGMHTAQSEELQLIADLFREDPEAFWRGNKKQRDYWNEQLLLQALDTYSLIPKSDPNTPSHIHRIMKAVGLVQLAGDMSIGPLLNKKKIAERVLMAMRENPADLLLPPAPPPNPELNPDLIEAKAREKNATGKILDAQAKLGANQVRAADIAQRGELGRASLEAEGAMKSVDMAQTILKTRTEDQREKKKFGLDLAKHHLNAADTTHRAALDTMVALKPEKPKGP